MAIRIARAGIIAALYIALCYLLNPLSFGPLQFRAAEALTLLPILFPEAVPALFIGAVIGNLQSPMGMVDIIGGSLTTLAAAYVTYRFRESFIAYLSPIIFNAIFVSIYIAWFFKVPYLLTVLYIGLGEAAVVFTLGNLLLLAMRRYLKNT